MDQPPVAAKELGTALVSQIQYYLSSLDRLDSVIDQPYTIVFC